MFSIFNFKNKIKQNTPTQKNNLDKTSETHSYELKAKKICNHEQNDGHNDNDDENIQLKNNVLNLNIPSVDLDDIDSGSKQPKLQALFSIDKEALRCEMTVACNCAIQLKPNFGLEEFKTIISKEVYHNIHSLLEVALILLPINSASCE
ncbi:hypothetical protein QTP88_014215 [Uroleucon formosanum]